MSNQSVQTVNTSGDTFKVVVAVIAAIAGVVGFYFFAGSSRSWLRIACLVGGLVLALVFAWSSTSGREFIGFAKESVREAKKVVWPTRKESMQITGIVFAFAVIMAIFLFGTDKLLEFLLYNVILGWQK